MNRFWQLRSIINFSNKVYAEDSAVNYRRYRTTSNAVNGVTGLTAATRDTEGFRHVTAMADYALRLRKQLKYVNEHSFNSFRIRIGNKPTRYTRGARVHCESICED